MIELKTKQLPNFKFISTKSFYNCLFFLVVQQLIVASSIYFITRTIQSYNSTTPESSLSYLALYLFSLAIPFIPGAISVYFLRKWKVEVGQKLSSKYAQEAQGNIDLWLNHEAKEKILSFLSSELILCSNRFVDSAYSLLSILLNISFTILSLAAFVDFGLLPIYLLSLFASGLIYALTYKKVSKLELCSQGCRNKVNEVLRRSWDALLINNLANKLKWLEVFEASNKDYRLAEANAEMSKQKANVLLSFTSLSPTLAYTAWIVVHQFSNTSKVLATLVNFPRIFMLMNHTYALLCETLEFNSSYKIWEEMKNSLSPDAYPNQIIAQNIKAEKIEILDKNKNKILINDFKQLKLNKLTGKFTIKGDNGSGKSLTLAEIKKLYGEQAFLLPCKHDLFIDDSQNLSSGQRSAQSIQWLLGNSVNGKVLPHILLLDEWDANLDIQKISEAQEAISTLALNHLVIEVRHRE